MSKFKLKNKNFKCNCPKISTLERTYKKYIFEGSSVIKNKCQIFSYLPFGIGGDL